MTALTIGGDGCGGDSGRMADDTIAGDKIRSDALPQYPVPANLI